MVMIQFCKIRFRQRCGLQVLSCCDFREKIQQEIASCSYVPPGKVQSGIKII